MGLVSTSQPKPERAEGLVARRGRVRLEKKVEVAPSRVVRRSAMPEVQRRDGQSRWLRRGGSTLSHAERERVTERLTFFALSGVLALVVLLVGGTLLWDKVIVGQRPVVRVDGRATSLRQYADLLSYRQNALFAEFQQVQQLASQPPPAGTDPAQANLLTQLAGRRLTEIQNRSSGLSLQLVEDLIDEQIIRDEASKRKMAVTGDEIDGELKRLVGYQDPRGTPVPDAAAATTGPDAAPTAASERDGRRAASFQTRYRDFQRLTGGTDALIRHDVETELARRKLGEQLAQTVSDRGEQVRARHILVPDETAATAVQARLAAGESFQALSAELSTDTSTKDKGGDLGWFPRGVMISEFEEAAFTLQPGQTSEPVRTSFGTHIISVDERDVNRELEPRQLEALKNSALTKWLEGERANHTIERFFDSEKLDWASRNGRQPSQPSSARR